MINKLKTTAIAYGGGLCFILGWWYLAFGSMQGSAIPSEKNAAEVTLHESFPKSNAHPLHASFVSRSQLRAALEGDIEAIAMLISKWDIESQLLQEEGYPNIRQLPKGDLLKSHRLYLSLKEGSIEDPLPFNSVDAQGKKLEVKNPFDRFLPQTHMAASFLLALLSTEKIIALPAAVKEQIELYPMEKTKQIALTIERQNSEKIFEKKPDIALVALYSNPATLQAFAEQGTQLYTLRSPNSIDDIIFELKQVGKLAGSSRKAELLSLFIKAAMIALDNQVAIHLQNETKTASKRRLLFVHRYDHLSMPSMHSITHELLQRLQRLGIEVLSKEHQDLARMPSHLGIEQLLAINCHHLIISSFHPKDTAKALFSNPHWQQLATSGPCKISIIDEVIQQAACQHVVQAYYDIVLALLKGNPCYE